VLKVPEVSHTLILDLSRGQACSCQKAAKFSLACGCPPKASRAEVLFSPDCRTARKVPLHQPGYSAELR